MNGFIKLHRSRNTKELLKNSNCFMLLTIIAIRAKRTDSFSIHNLKQGEALIGDYKSCGLSQGQYRTAKRNLEKWGFATFKATNKGTIAKLTDTSIFDINQNDAKNSELKYNINQLRKAWGAGNHNAIAKFIDILQQINK